MPDLGFLTTPQQLQTLGNLLPENYYAGQDWLKRAQAADVDAAQRLPTLRDLEQQKITADTEGTRAMTAERQARLPQITAEVAQAQRDWQARQGVPLDAETKAKWSELTSKASDNDLKTLTNDAKARMAKAAQEGDQDAYQKAYQIWQHSAEQQDIRLKARDAEMLAMQNNQAKFEREKLGVDQRREAATARQAAQNNLEVALAKLPVDKRMSYLNDEIAKEQAKGEAADPAALSALIMRKNAQLEQYNTEQENLLKRNNWTKDPTTGQWTPPKATPVQPTPQQPVPQRVAPAAQQPALPQQMPADKKAQVELIRSKLTGQDRAAFNWLLTANPTDPNYKAVQAKVDQAIKKIQSQLVP